ncbi:uncharacterized protein BX663DRAFT_328220 [Cokeromyces recurvatus]|uniref:uncharacterized protein n=1 Tax=Cokeromyces recurvatus TaxID=90255 RepID=UPI00221FF45C|nr:uncharacterized protein BX663DRAFT_328220 [Cokeromyces recurvatus]KAI7904794.1 hypothetical protein BX663DRAFT_328220 [Cokeromyces recurvatus]
MESQLTDEEYDFQEPIIIPTDSFIRKRKQMENEDDEEENEDENEVTLCPLCQTSWTNTGNHRIVNLKCGHVFGKICIDDHIKDMMSKSLNATCPTCHKNITKSEPRRIWPTKLIPENEDDLQSIRQEIQNAKETLNHLIQQNQVIKAEINQYKIQLNELQPLNVIQDLVNNSQFTVPKQDKKQGQFILQQKIALPKENYGIIDVYPFTCMAVVSTYKSSNQTYGLRKFNLYDPAITEFVPTNHTDTIRDIKHASSQEMVLTTGDDKTLKLISVSKNLVVQSYQLDAPSLTCCFDERNSNLLYCGLVTGEVMMYDIRNTKTYLHKLKKPISPRPIRSIFSYHHSIICSDDSDFYTWSLMTEDDSTYQYNSLHLDSDKRNEFISVSYHDTTFYTVTWDQIAQEQNHCVSHIDNNNNQIAQDWTFTTKTVQQKESLWRNTTHFKRDDDILICYCHGDNQIVIRDKEKEVQSFRIDGDRINDVVHTSINQSELLITLSNKELQLYKLS